MIDLAFQLLSLYKSHDVWSQVVLSQVVFCLNEGPLANQIWKRSIIGQTTSKASVHCF